MSGWTKWDTYHSLVIGSAGGATGTLCYYTGTSGMIGSAVIAGAAAWVSSIVMEFIEGK